MLGARMMMAASGISAGGVANLLLDDFPGAAIAASVARKLDKDYAGSAIRVRRSNDNAEQDIGFDGNGDLDESALTTFVGANDGFVVTLYDQSGNGRDFTQATAGQQPQIVTTGTVAKEHAKPAILGGDNKILDSGFSGLTEKTIFAVANTIDAAANGVSRIFAGYDGGAVGDDCLFDTTPSLRFFDGGDSISDASHTQGARLYYAHRNASELAIAYDGGTLTTGGSPNGNANPAVSYKLIEEGGANTDEYPENIQEIILYGTDQSANRADIETNINGYYSIY